MTDFKFLARKIATLYHGTNGGRVSPTVILERSFFTKRLPRLHGTAASAFRSVKRICFFSRQFYLFDTCRFTLVIKETSYSRLRIVALLPSGHDLLPVCSFETTTRHYILTQIVKSSPLALGFH